MLDGVFNHTGRKSVYFNADGFYDDLGAAQGELRHYFPKFRLPRKVPYDMVLSALDLTSCGDARAVRIFFL